jgi:hypothetical protein
MVENILDIVRHGCFPGMVLSSTSVEFVSGFQSTFRESTNRKIKMINKSSSVAQEPVYTLWDFINIEGRSDQLVKENSGFIFKKDLAWLFIGIVELFQQF